MKHLLIALAASVLLVACGGGDADTAPDERSDPAWISSVTSIKQLVLEEKLAVLAAGDPARIALVTEWNKNASILLPIYQYACEGNSVPPADKDACLAKAFSLTIHKLP